MHIIYIYVYSDIQYFTVCTYIYIVYITCILDVGTGKRKVKIVNETTGKWKVHRAVLRWGSFSSQDSSRRISVVSESFLRLYRYRRHNHHNLIPPWKNHLLAVTAAVGGPCKHDKKLNLFTHTEHESQVPGASLRWSTFFAASYIYRPADARARERERRRKVYRYYLRSFDIRIKKQNLWRMTMGDETPVTSLVLPVILRPILAKVSLSVFMLMCSITFYFFLLGDWDIG